MRSINTVINSTSPAAVSGGIQTETGSYTRTDGSVGVMAAANDEAFECRRAA